MNTPFSAPQHYKWFFQSLNMFKYYADSVWSQLTSVDHLVETVIQANTLDSIYEWKRWKEFPRTSTSYSSTRWNKWLFLKFYNSHIFFWFSAVQIAKLLGLKIIATGRSEKKLQTVKELGADHILNIRSIETESGISQFRDQVRALTERGKGVDIVYDPIGAKSLRI